MFIVSFDFTRNENKPEHFIDVKLKLPISERKKRYNREYYRKNRDRLLAHHKEQYVYNNDYYLKYYQKHRDRILVYHKDHYANHKDYYQKYHQKHRDRLVAYRKEYYLKNKQYYQENKEKLNMYNRRYRLNNKERIKEKHLCECGRFYTHSNKSGHMKTQKHLKWISENKA